MIKIFEDILQQGCFYGIYLRNTVVFKVLNGGGLPTYILLFKNPHKKSSGAKSHDLAGQFTLHYFRKALVICRYSHAQCPVFDKMINTQSLYVQVHIYETEIIRYRMWFYELLHKVINRLLLSQCFKQVFVSGIQFRATISQFWYENFAGMIVKSIAKAIYSYLHKCRNTSVQLTCKKKTCQLHEWGPLHLTKEIARAINNFLNCIHKLRFFFLMAGKTLCQ